MLSRKRLFQEKVGWSLQRVVGILDDGCWNLGGRIRKVTRLPVDRPMMVGRHPMRTVRSTLPGLATVTSLMLIVDWYPVIVRICVSRQARILGRRAGCLDRHNRAQRQPGRCLHGHRRLPQKAVRRSNDSLGGNGAWCGKSGIADGALAPKRPSTRRTSRQQNQAGDQSPREFCVHCFPFPRLRFRVRRRAAASIGGLTDLIYRPIYVQNAKNLR